MSRLRRTVDVTGWRHTRRWIIGVRRGEWWVGARRNFAADCVEVNVFGLTALIPYERTTMPTDPTTA